jgi:TRAP-type mannitol/chloroaromatic compound transport system permease small subunit
LPTHNPRPYDRRPFSPDHGEEQAMNLLRVSAALDRLNHGIGRAASWLVLLMVLLGAFNAIARYLGRFVGMQLSSNAYLELQWYMFSLIFLLGAAYTLRHDAHVRVDVLFARLSARGRAWVNLLGTALLLMPFCVFMLVVTWPPVRNSWRIHEGSPDPGGLPRYPLKALILVCFTLLLLQGIAELIREVAALRGNAPSEHDQLHGPTEGV